MSDTTGVDLGLFWKRLPVADKVDIYENWAVCRARLAQAQRDLEQTRQVKLALTFVSEAYKRLREDYVATEARAEAAEQELMYRAHEGTDMVAVALYNKHLVEAKEAEIARLREFKALAEGLRRDLEQSYRLHHDAFHYTKDDRSFIEFTECSLWVCKNRREKLAERDATFRDALTAEQPREQQG